LYRWLYHGAALFDLSDGRIEFCVDRLRRRCPGRHGEHGRSFPRGHLHRYRPIIERLLRCSSIRSDVLFSGFPARDDLPAEWAARAARGRNGWNQRGMGAGRIPGAEGIQAMSFSAAPRRGVVSIIEIVVLASCIVAAAFCGHRDAVVIIVPTL